MNWILSTRERELENQITITKNRGLSSTEWQAAHQGEREREQLWIFADERLSQRTRREKIERLASEGRGYDCRQQIKIWVPLSIEYGFLLLLSSPTQMHVKPLPVFVSQKGENVFFLFCESWKLSESLHNLTDQTESPNLSSSTIYETIESVHKNVTNHTMHICRVDEQLYQELIDF